MTSYATTTTYSSDLDVDTHTYIYTLCTQVLSYVMVLPKILFFQMCRKLVLRFCALCPLLLRARVLCCPRVHVS